MKQSILLPAEWHPQSAIQLTWPHENTDWNYMLEEIVEAYVKIASEILKRQKLMIVCHNDSLVRLLLTRNNANLENLILVEIPTNDTWARDHAGISILKGDQKLLYDFSFNGWGLKYIANYDNQINRNLAKKSILNPSVEFVNKKNFVLEGGAIESDGKGTLLTTSQCLLSPNRNPYLSKDEIETYLKDIFGLNRVLWLDYGHLEGDDTDSHIDTLARFCDEHTIAYVKCEDSKDEHYAELAKMEEQLKTFLDYTGKPYNLIPLPMAEAVHNDSAQRLPATYANFLIMNNTILVPFYNNKEKDEEAKKQLEKAFPGKDVIGVDCSPIICQGGSLHCITMQFPEGFI